jgi:tetratricopeptide (TPR) repeat protein
MTEMRAGLCRAVGMDPADFADDAAGAPADKAVAGASMWSGPTLDATSQADNEAPGAGDGGADPAPDVHATALARPGKPAMPPARAPEPRASVDQAVRSALGRAISDSGVHSTPAPQSSSTRPLLARIATPAPMRSQVVNPPKKRLGLWIGAVIAAVAATALSLVLVRTSARDGSTSGAADRAGRAAGEAAPGAPAGQAPPGQDPGESRQRLDRMIAEHGEPAAPQPCQTRDPALLARLASAAAKLAQGGPGSERAQDTEAVRILSGPAPDQAEYWYWLAKARLYAGANHESIIDATGRAIKLCDAYAAAYSVAGTAEFRAKNATAAESLYRRALELESDFYTAQYNLGLVQLERGRIAEGIDTFTQVIARDPGSADALVARGQAHLMARDPGSAVRDLERATRANPQSATAFWLLGHAYNALDQRDDARRALCAAGQLGHAEAAEQCNE